MLRRERNEDALKVIHIIIGEDYAGYSSSVDMETVALGSLRNALHGGILFS